MNSLAAVALYRLLNAFAERRLASVTDFNTVVNISFDTTGKYWQKTAVRTSLECMYVWWKQYVGTLTNCDETSTYLQPAGHGVQPGKASHQCVDRTGRRADFLLVWHGSSYAGSGLCSLSAPGGYYCWQWGQNVENIEEGVRKHELKGEGAGRGGSLPPQRFGGSILGKVLKIFGQNSACRFVLSKKMCSSTRIIWGQRYSLDLKFLTLRGQLTPLTPRPLIAGTTSRKQHLIQSCMQRCKTM